MRVRFSIVLALSALAGLNPVSSAIAGADCAGSLCDEPIAGQAVLRLERGFTIEQINADYGSTLLGEADVGSDPRYLVQVPDGQTALQYIGIVEQDSRIKKAEQNFEVGDPDPGTQSFFFASVLGDYWNQPSRDILGLNTTTPDGADAGVRITVAIIDTGLDATHPFLQDAVRGDGVSFIPGDASTADTGDGVDNDGDGVADELVGHGTFVAGLVRLVAPEADLLPIRIVESDGASNLFRLAQGIAAAIDGGADVINLSLGSNIDLGVVEDAVLDAVDLGIPVICSVGNDGLAEPIRYPAGYTGMIAVAGTDNEDRAAAFTNFGTHVSLSAPAVRVGSTIPGGGFGYADGTSYSAPLVTGVVARMLAADPTLTPAQITTILSQTAEPIDSVNPGLEGLLGAGRLNAGAALQAVGATAPMLLGDVNGDEAVDFSDLNEVLAYWSQSSSQGDANASGFVDFRDLECVLEQFGLSLR